MNRDWFAMTQPETQARVRTFLSFWPLLYVDLHEMGGNSSYYFPPPAQPVNAEITATQREWLVRYGRNNARWFDRYGFELLHARVVRQLLSGLWRRLADVPRQHRHDLRDGERARASSTAAATSSLLHYRDGVMRHFGGVDGDAGDAGEGAARRRCASFLQHRRAGVARGDQRAR